MFIAIAGTRFSGKSTVEDYLVNQKGFKAVRLIAPNDGESILEGNIGVRRDDLRAYSKCFDA